MPRKKIASDETKILAVIQNKSISKAAKILGISQSSLSTAIHQIEQDLGLKLFTRSEEGIELTKAGEIYAQYARLIRNTEEELYKQMEYLKSSLRHVHIALPMNISSLSIMSIYQEINKRFPDTKIHFNNVYSNDILPGILSRQYDFAVSWDMSDGEKTTFDPFFKDHLILLVPNKFKISSTMKRINGRQVPCVDVQSINGMDFVLQERHTSIRDTIELFFKENNIKVNPKIYVSNSMVAIKAVEEQIGCAIILEAYSSLIEGEGKLKKYVIDYDPDEVIGLLKLKDKELSEVEEYTVNVIRSYLEKRNEQYFLNDYHL